MNADPVPAAPTLPNPPRRRRWLKLILLAVVFLSGMLTGVGGLVLAVRNRILEMPRFQDQPPARIASVLGKRLGLNNDQVRQLQPIIERRQQNLLELRREIQPRVVTEAKRLEEDVAALLDDKQKAAWRQLCAAQLRNWLPASARSEGSPERKEKADNDHE